MTCPANKAAAFVNRSTSGGSPPMPTLRRTLANPCSPYALTKLHGRVGRDGLGAPTCPPGWAARRHGALLAQ
ncbi:MAG: hypothetical protein WCO57_16290 [Verrucomicrobiota bacterium]